MGQLAGDLQVGVDRDGGALPLLVQLRGDGGRRVAGSARFLALGVDDGAVLAAVLFDETHLTAELAGDGADLDLDLAEVVVALVAGQLRPRHQWDHLLQVAQHVPRLLDGGADGELVGDLHAVVLSFAAVLRLRSTLRP